MKTEHTDHVFGALLEKATPAMRDGWEERATEAMPQTRPRRTRVWILALAVLSLAGLGAAHVIPLFIEGDLYFRSAQAGPGWTTGYRLHYNQAEFRSQSWGVSQRVRQIDVNLQ